MTGCRQLCSVDWFIHRAEEKIITAANPTANKKSSAMSVGEKLVFFGKFVIFLVTFGFAFGNLLADD